MKYAGQCWRDKLKNVRIEMKKNSYQALFLGKLDEIAWLFNLRGSDIPYNPVFYSYAIIEMEKDRALFEKMKISFFSNDEI